MTAELDLFIEEARQVSIAQAVPLLGLKLAGKRDEHAGPCPVCGGTDTFAFNTRKNKWNCRTGGVGGQDAIGLAAHVLGLTLSTREGFLEACAAVSGRPVPDGGERESDADRAARLARLEALRLKHYEEMARQQADANDFRDRERRRARGIYEAAAPLRGSGMTFGRFYLQRRGCGVPDDRWLHVADDVTYWHGQDELGRPAPLHSGPAMIAPFISLPPVADGEGFEIIGCHITWIDLDRPTKYRPAIVDPKTGELLPTKKMRGTKQGGLIPLAGRLGALRWLGAEGIENTLAFARWEGFRGDTFYFAAGDLGNLAGPADPKSRFAHPEVTKPDRNGIARPVMVAGPVPLIRPDRADAMVVADHVDELVLLGDADSERVMTASAMARAKARHARPGRLIPVVWPRPGTDFAALMAGADAAYD